ncbi:unnamed protein product [Allacma fusca]|uniref:Uncharacterized protein n=1 Tax=Allacma fusca TaxID=39272 RepID=A0A8J2J5L2_9HEXA|nr:unnamed protein product [Allacma fusca]
MKRRWSHGYYEIEPLNWSSPNSLKLCVGGSLNFDRLGPRISSITGFAELGMEALSAMYRIVMGSESK